MNDTKITIKSVVARYLEIVHDSRSENTARSYQNALKLYLAVLNDHGVFPDDDPTKIPDISIAWLIKALKSYSVATERLYLSAISGFFEYLYAEQLSAPNLPRVKNLISHRARKPLQRLPQFPQSDIEKLIHIAINIDNTAVNSQAELLRQLRDRAFIIVLADTGLRVHEACKLDRGSIDWDEAVAIVTIKGNRESVIRFSDRSLAALKLYLNHRAPLDGRSGKPLASQPLFARHDRGTSKKIQRITPTTGRNIINNWVREYLGENAIGTITPHSFRHYFVTVVLRSSGNLKLAQELARHKNIAITQRYAHLSNTELDRGYHEIFNQPENPMKHGE
jgi:site-specific recombinase XerD